jgi:hypothetical protein
MEQSRHLLFIKTTVILLAILCTLMACHASIDKKGGAHDAIVGWGDQIFSTISQKMNELTDFDTIKQIIDATIEEDCYVEDCPAGKMAYSSFY